MTVTDLSKDEIQNAEKYIGYFRRNILSIYQSQPDKYVIKSDDFDGKLSIRDDYAESVEEITDWIDIRFGYRALVDGEFALVVWLPDLFEKSEAHVDIWRPFFIHHPIWDTGPDSRFSKWIKRYIQGSWSIDNGPTHRLNSHIKVINAITMELVGMPLYAHEISEHLRHPVTNNTHAYQDAHRELYGYLLDSINKTCIEELAKVLGKKIQVSSKRTKDALTELLPSLKSSSTFLPAMSLVSDQRALAAHNVRPGAAKYPAFEKFISDLELCANAIHEVLNGLETAFHINGKKAKKKQEEKMALPKIVRPPEANYSIVKAAQMKGKTIDSVEFGFRESHPDVHESEAIIIHFTDGTIMGIRAGSNVTNLISSKNELKPNDFHVDFIIDWVHQ